MRAVRPMKRLTKPTIDPEVVLDDCVKDIGDEALALKFTNARVRLLELAKEYDERADSASLHAFQAAEHGKPKAIVVEGLSKGELVDLYVTYMVKGSSGRVHYDKLLNSAPLGLCPYCRFGNVATLDHFLSKARYPGFAVVPANLVPSCTDCNKGKKSSGVVAAGRLPLHPYFEAAAVEADVWLFATVQQSKPASVRYWIRPPDGWPDERKKRLENYFADFSLATRLPVQAAGEIASVADYLRLVPDEGQRRDHLLRTASSERASIRKNSWKAALYEALAHSEWFWTEGYAGSFSRQAEEVGEEVGSEGGD